MSETAKLLDRVKAMHNLTSDNKLAEWLEWPQPTIASYRTGHSCMDVPQIREFSRKTGVSLEEVINAVADDKIAKKQIRRTVTAKAA